MNRRQFVALFLCSLITWWVGAGLMPLLPIYAARLGASPTVVGNYLSFIFLALATGTVWGGWIAAKLRRYRQLLLGIGIIGAPTTWLMGQIGAIWQLILLNAILWFMLGLVLAIVNIIAGETTAQDKRGRVFGLFAMTSSLGGMLGGATGFIADGWGYPTLFTWVSWTWLVFIVAACFVVIPKQIVIQALATGMTDVAQGQSQPQKKSITWGLPSGAFMMLVVAALLVSAGGLAGSMGRSLAMEAHGFTTAMITSIAALGSACGLIFSPLLGRLSDRTDRRWLLGLIYLTGALALVMMAYSSTTLDFVAVAVLTAISGAERAISSALASDLLPQQMMARGLSLFEGVKWLGGVVGFAGTGYVIQQLGLSQALLAIALLPVLAIAIVLFMRREQRQPQPLAAPRLEAA